MSKKILFTTIDATRRLLKATETAINNIIEEVQKPVDEELSGSQRKAELQSIKQSVIDARELLQERQRLEQMIKDLEDNDSISEQNDFSGGFAERFRK
jgi:hypothetical protein